MEQLGGLGTGVAAVRQVRHICLPCKRKFQSAAALTRHEESSDTHRRSLEKREERMKKRKKELIMAARTVRQQIFEADEALQSGTGVQDIVQNQKGLLELQLQQLLGEYGQAQELIEAGRLLREAKEDGAEMSKQRHQVRVGALQVS